MSVTEMLILVAVMTSVTYVIRMIPLVFFRKKITSVFIRSVLYYVPYAVLSAMTFPSVFYSTGSVVASVCATAIAVVASANKKPLLFVAVCAVITALMIQAFAVFL